MKQLIDVFLKLLGTIDLKTYFDKLLLTFSSDWMRHYYPFGVQSLCRINIDDMQNSARDAFHYFIGDHDNYWHCDRSDEHLEQSKKMFYHQLISNSVEQEYVDDFFRFINNEESISFEENQLYWFFEHTTRDMAHDNEYVTLLDDVGSLLFNNQDYSDYCLKYKEFFKNIMKEDVSLGLKEEQEWLKSDTKWDKYIRSLTPDMPELVYVELDDLLIHGEVQPIFMWNEYTNEMDSAIKNSLIKWYRMMYLNLTEMEDVSIFEKWIQ